MDAYLQAAVRMATQRREEKGGKGLDETQRNLLGGRQEHFERSITAPLHSHTHTHEQRSDRSSGDVQSPS